MPRHHGDKRAAAQSQIEVPPAVVSRIRSFLRPEDWDGEGAPAITEEACLAAIDLLDRIERSRPGSPLPRTAASALGGVSLHWQRDNRSFSILVSGPSAYLRRAKTLRQPALVLRRPSRREHSERPA